MNAQIVLSTEPQVGSYSNIDPQSLLSAPRMTELSPRQSFECELQYYLPLKQLPNSARDLIGAAIEIRQAYFEKAAVPELVSHVRNCLGSLGEYESYDFTSARLRMQQSGLEQRLTLDIKGGKLGPEGMRILRPEISLVLDSEEFHRLLPRATRGILVKSRVPLDGQVFDSDGSAHDVKLHIDIIREAGGQNLRNTAMRLPEFAFIEVEFFGDKGSCMQLAQRFRQGHHDQSFLKGAPEISALEKEVAAPLRSKRLAREGFGEKARTLVFDLHTSAVLLRRASIDKASICD